MEAAGEQPPRRKPWKLVFWVVFAGLLTGIAVIFLLESRPAKLNSFASCVAYGYPVTGTAPQICTAAGRTYTGPYVSPPTPTSIDIPFETVGAFSGPGTYPEKNDIIDDAVAWKAYWEAVHADATLKPALPAVDFEHKTLVGISQGPYRSASVGIKVTSVRKQDGKIIVSAEMIKPGQTCPAEAGTLAPASMIAFDTQKEPITFDIRSKSRQCR